MLNCLPGNSLRCITFALSLVAVGCAKRDGSIAWWQGEQQRIELTHQLALKEFRLERLGANDLPELEKLRMANQVMTASLKSLKQRHSALGEEIESLQGSFAGFRETVIQNQRSRVIGRSFSQLTSISGRVYHEVTVASIDDAGVAIRHVDGTARLKYQELDSAQRLMFALEPDLALAAAEKESQNLAIYEQWIDGQLDLQRDKIAVAARMEDYQEQISKANRAAAIARQSLAAKSSPLAKPATSFGAVRSRYSSSYRSERPTYYRYVYYAPNNYTPSISQACYGSGSSSYRPDRNKRRTNFANTTFQSDP